ncbi:hypothetical protein PHYBLDRAFT_138823 [Phycomyces blakesleeanus NRRL 1555(-)]|uniref:DDE Tnp4 domain-containing protein n=1 Tax=Phycomyces blakesleeanus (strain ATCC 8743b / DSM 1359 / FGSC 10004 / NBRC 33097 / NRRL 1555) TaxID=763407 RepID=A0A167RB99_PHYB8|nr:hypothetical protein PHYBLDRAFT_138823 [Phycomyces blakesleeanus NRRL 1555(-)]OAD81274.1 hypothetical protein PHYBLDRAFT_138823 [Phycomyces blakesleeanus NRRL 1555(-)]|eukprot:XP_018299314.1 hypothetical protein PHYBLDRAFT_138823 [Phycomyces blakesleeanus NRRL 1555(-)]
MSSILIDNVIIWPNTIERTLKITTGFGQPTKSGKQRLKEVIGAIDRKLISIEKPTTANSGDSYVDRKENISMNLTAVCDYKKIFIHIATGSLHDTHVLKLDCLYQDLIHQEPETCLENTYIIADLAYPLLPQLLAQFIAVRGYADDMWELEENEDDDILGNFQDSDNADDTVFGLGEIENTNPIMSERVLNALLAQLKTGGEQRRLTTGETVLRGHSIISAQQE